MSNQSEVPAAMRRPDSHDFPTGPDLGERMPPIVLVDQRGELVDVEQARGNRRALIVFHRSLGW